MNTPIPPPVPKLNVKFPLNPKFAVPCSIYTPVPPLLMLSVDVPVANVVPFFTYIPIPPSVVIFPLWLRVIPVPPRYIPTPSFAFTVTLFIVYVLVIPASNSIPTDVLASFAPGPDSGMLAPVSITAPLNVTVSLRRNAPTEPCPVLIFPEIIEFPLAATPTAPLPVTFTTKSISASSPNTPTPPEPIFKVPVVILLASVFFR